MRVLENTCDSKDDFGTVGFIFQNIKKGDGDEFCSIKGKHQKSLVTNIK